MTDLIYEDQSAEALRLNLVQGAVDKKLLTVLCTGQVDLPYGQVEVGIIGASHFFEFIYPDGSVIFTEVFACKDLDVNNRVYYGDLKDSGSIRKHFGDVTYNFTSCKYNWEEGEKKFEELFELVQPSYDDFQIGLQFVFPRAENDLFTPLTLVYLKANPETLNVEVNTLHAYPNEDSLVFTKTILQQR